jgi:hypothetical protein
VGHEEGHEHHILLDVDPRQRINIEGGGDEGVGDAAFFLQAGDLRPVRIADMDPVPRQDLIDDRKAIRSRFEHGDHGRLHLRCCRLDRTRIALIHLYVWRTSASWDGLHQLKHTGELPPSAASPAIRTAWNTGSSPTL